MAVILGLTAALTYGAADFVGGVASRRAGALRVVVLSQIAGLLLALLLLPLFWGNGPTVPALAWGAASGAAGGTGVALLYRALASGRMSVVAPITAVEAAAVPVLVGLARGEQPGALPLLGVLVALVAVVLVSSAPEPVVPAGPGTGLPAPPARARARLDQPGLVDALGAGLAFGLFFILLERAGTTDLWPLLGARVASVSLLLGLALARRRSLRPPAGTLPAIVTAGALDMGANFAYLVATTYGLLSLVAVLTSLYPASTVLLARIVLAERLVRTQVVGLAVATVGVVLIAA